jgi:hypothetical protein
MMVCRAGVSSFINSAVDLNLGREALFPAAGVRSGPLRAMRTYVWTNRRGVSLHGGYVWGRGGGVGSSPDALHGIMKLCSFHTLM